MQPQNFNINTSEKKLFQSTGTRNTSQTISGNLLLYTDPNEKKIQAELSQTVNLPDLQTTNDESIKSTATSTNQYDIFATQTTLMDSEHPSEISTSGTMNDSNRVSQIGETQPQQIKRYLSLNEKTNAPKPDPNYLLSTQQYQFDILQTQQQPEAQQFQQQQKVLFRPTNFKGN